jgi:peptidoglycan hydrolase CwlO-like protein
MEEKFSKEMEIMKNIQEENLLLETSINQVHTTVNSIVKRQDEVEERISEMEENIKEFLHTDNHQK